MKKPLPNQGQKAPPGASQTPVDGAQSPADGDSKLAERLIVNVTDQIFSHANEAIMETLETSDDLAMAIGQMTAEILKSQLDAMNAVGKKLSQDVYLDAGAVIVQNLTEIADAMGLVGAESEQDVNMLQSEALNNASQIFAQIGSEHIDGQALQQFTVDAASGKFDNMEQVNGPTG